MKKLLLMMLVLCTGVNFTYAGGAEGRRIYVKIVEHWGDEWNKNGISLHVWGANSEGDLTGGWNNCSLTRIGNSDWAYIQTNELPSEVKFIVYCNRDDNWRITNEGVDLRNKYIELTNSSTATIKDLSYSVIDATNKAILGTMSTSDNLIYAYDVDATSNDMEVLIAPSFVSVFGFGEGTALWSQCFRPYTSESSAGFGFENKTNQHFGIWNNSEDSWSLNARVFYHFTFEPNRLEGMTISPYFTKTMSADYATFASDYAVAIPEGVTASYATGVSEGTLTTANFTNGIAANTGALLYKAGGGEVSFIPATSTDDLSDKTNYFVAVSSNGTNVSQEADSKTNYILTNKTVDNANAPLRFYMVNENGNTVNAGKAYLSIPSAMASAREFFSLDEDITAISTSKADQRSTESYYNMNGQRIAQPTKGIYIVNGKKIIIK